MIGRLLPCKSLFFLITYSIPDSMNNQLLTLLQHPGEWKYIYKVRKRFKAYKPDPRSLEDLSSELTDIEFCYAALSKVSRSFSVVVRLLPGGLRDAVCLFYLVLRGLDSIEDDTSIRKEVRIKLLSNFHKFIYDGNWNLSGIGTDKDYRMLLENFHKVNRSFLQLDSKYQDIISRICREMGEGMVLYLDRELENTAEYNEYCYYVAGLVGVGLTELFTLSGLEDERLLNRRDLQIAMGQFLQKTNIIRDIREDLDESRTFWPRQIWGQYMENINDYKDSDSVESIFGLNHMVADALDLVPHCLEYLRMIKNPGIFQFCAIPQVMAIATLAEVFHNPDVFKRNVKIRKGLSAVIFENTTDYKTALHIYHAMAEYMFDKISVYDPNLEYHARNFQNILSVKETFTVYRNPKEPVGIREKTTDIDLQHMLNLKAQ